MVFWFPTFKSDHGDPGTAAWISSSQLEKATEEKGDTHALTMSQSIIRKPTGLPDLPSGVNDFVRKLFSVCNESVARQVSIFPFTHEEGCRVVPAKTVADGLLTKQKGYAPSYQDVEGMFSGRQIALQANAGWRLEDFACDLFLACKVGLVDDSRNFETMIALLNQKSSPISAAISVTFDFNE